MKPEDIQHFLLILDISEEKVHVRPFGHDYELALQAYEDAERDARDAGRSSDVDIVLLGADSIETIMRTHSSYFEQGRHAFQAELEDALALG